MRIAVYANGRVAKAAVGGIGRAFLVAFKAGSVMGFALVSLGVLMLFITINLFRLKYSEWDTKPKVTQSLYEAVAGFGLGGSTVGLFARVGGGIYTKAADVGADLVGKVEKGIPEDDPRNPAVIADNVGDNVGDIAGMGADLFGSFAEATCAAQVLTAQSVSPQVNNSAAALGLPLIIIATGIVVCFFTTFFSTHFFQVKSKEDVEPSLKRQLIVSTLIETPVLVVLTYFLLPNDGVFSVDENHNQVKWWHVFFCIAAGLWSGLIIGFITEYYTSHSYLPVREVADSCKTGAATNVIFGLALGYKSVIVPVFCMAGTIFLAFSLAGMYGIAMAALGILSTLPVALTIDAYGPISDNAGGIAEMAHMGEHIREHTDALDAAGNTTAAIGKGFAIGSAAFVSLALFGAFVETTRNKTGNHVLQTVNILEPWVFAGLLVGAMLPYWFSAMTMKSVGQAAYSMVEEVRQQFRTIPGLMEGTGRPDYARCVGIATEAAVAEMIAPGLLVVISPIMTGFLFGPTALAGLLAGSLVSGVQIAISASNTGGAWDNAKKFIEAGGVQVPIDAEKSNETRPSKKGDDVHKAAVTGDTVGDPLKDTSGPSLNILIKLMAIISLVFARAFPQVGYVPQLFGASATA
jgi:inorganic pyrophosphatase